MDARVEKFKAHMASVGARETAVSYAKWADKAEAWATAAGQRVSSRRLIYDWAVHLASEPGALGRSKNTIKVACTALRRYLDWLTVQGYPVAAQAKPEIAPDIQPVRFTPTEPQMHDLLAAVDQRAREPYATLAHIIAGTGMRVSEAVALRDDDGRLQSGWIVFTLRRTKNMKAREVPLLPDYADRFGRYLREVRPALVEGSERVARNDWLFPIPAGARRIARNRSVSRQQIAREVRHAGRTVGIPATPHSLRRYYVTSMMRRGVPEATIMKVIGHTNPHSFRLYFQPTAEDLIVGLAQPTGG